MYATQAIEMRIETALLIAQLHQEAIWASVTDIGTGRSHRTMNTEFAGHIVRRRNYATAFRRATDDHGLADERRGVAFLDRGVESIYVDVEDHAELYGSSKGAFERLSLNGLALF